MALSIDSRLLHAHFREHRTTINWRETKNFAAALRDVNPVYFDDLREKGIVAPPTFPVALTWPIIEHLNDYLADTEFPENVLPTIVHSSEQLLLHRMLKPGDHLSISTQIAALLPHKSGTQLFLRFDASDQKNKIVFTEITGALLRGVSCLGKCGGKENLLSTYTIPEGNSLLWKKKLLIDPLLPYLYDGCTNVVFPIHTSRKFARQVGLPDIILQGTATLGLVVKEIVNANLNSDPGKLKRIQARFSGMVFPGTQIEIQLFEGQKKGGLQEFHFVVLNKQKQAVIKEGFAEAEIKK